MRVEHPHCRVPTVPQHGHAIGPVPKEPEVELKASAVLHLHQLAQLVNEHRPAIWSQAHHLELVAVSVKPEILSHRGVQDTKRVREKFSLDDVESLTVTNSHRRAGKV